VPTKWAKHPKFQALIQHRYPVGDIGCTIDLVRDCLSELGYRFGEGDDEQRIQVHYATAAV
jgi:hypothetical protein